MSKTSLRASIIAGALLLLSGGAHAAGLGKLTVQTHLGEPLRAEIDVVAVEKGELDTLSARLASPDAYVLHLAISIGPTEWLEPVSDDDYSRAAESL